MSFDGEIEVLLGVIGSGSSGVEILLKKAAPYV